MNYLDNLRAHPIRDGYILAIFLTLTSYVIGNLLGYVDYTKVGYVELAAVFTSYACTYMCNFETRHNYLIGVVSVFFYSWLFFQLGSTSLGLFNIYLFFSLAYGYFRWGRDDNTRPVTTMTAHNYVTHAALGVAVTFLFIAISIGVAMHENPTLTVFTAFKGLSPIDVGLAAASGVAQFMLDNKKLENWILWILIDIVSIPYLWSLGSQETAIQYAFFMANAFWGFKLWNDSRKARLQVEDVGVTAAV